MIAPPGVMDRSVESRSQGRWSWYAGAYARMSLKRSKLCELLIFSATTRHFSRAMALPSSIGRGLRGCSPDSPALSVGARPDSQVPAEWSLPAHHDHPLRQGCPSPPGLG